MHDGSLYFLALIPDQIICEEITFFKEQSAALFKSKAALRSPPHITLHMPFTWVLKKEDILLEKLKQFSFNAYPFSVRLDGFDFFPPRVAFINVMENDLLSRLQKELVKHVRRTLHILNADYKERAFHPHITVAFRDLKKSRFNEAREHYSSIQYQAEFEVNGFDLLKHDGKMWQRFVHFGMDQ